MEVFFWFWRKRTPAFKLLKEIIQLYFTQSTNKTFLSPFSTNTLTFILKILLRYMTIVMPHQGYQSYPGNRSTYILFIRTSYSTRSSESEIFDVNNESSNVFCWPGLNLLWSGGPLCFQRWLFFFQFILWGPFCRK